MHKEYITMTFPDFLKILFEKIFSISITSYFFNFLKLSFDEIRDYLLIQHNIPCITMYSKYIFQRWIF
jgi:hypothetical protein